MSRSWSRHALPLAFAVSLLAPAVARGQGIQPHIPLKTTLAEIAALRSSYTDAYNAKDAAAISAMYTPDAMVVGSDGSVIMGASAIAKSDNDDAPNWPHIVITSTTVKVYGSMAIDVGTVTVHPKEGGEQVSRYLVVLHHGINGWKLQNAATTPVAK
jgi:uncharacterized protein (TIGR02246 family)